MSINAFSLIVPNENVNVIEETFHMISRFSDSFIFTIDETGITLKQMTLDHMAIITFEVNRNVFTRFEYEHELNITLEIVSITYMLNLLRDAKNNNDDVHIYTLENYPFIGMKSFPSDKRMTMNIIEGSNHINNMLINPSTYTIKISIDNNSLFNAALECQNDDNNSLKEMKIMINGNVVNIASENKVIDSFENTQINCGDQNTDFVLKCHSKYVSEFSKNKLLNNIEIYLNNNKPIIFIGNTSSTVKATMYLAPIL